ncbi:MAG: helix-turn-helix domain-containing protein [Planctomycetes bacterium]|nr:helix-turn-helix domain-containing protein [Planctomycetota bacterium]
MTPAAPNPPNEAGPDPEPVLVLIKQIKENRLDPALLSAEDRRRCVDVLGAEGYSVPEIAQILKRGERTIYRDRLELRAAHALVVHPQLALQMAGDLVRQAEGSIARLRRIAREPAASAMERSMAEAAAFKVHLDLISKLQSMGYLPRIPTNVVAQVVGATGSEAIATYDQLAQRLEALDLVDRELGVEDSEQRQRRRALGDLLRRARLAAEVEEAYPGPSSAN